VGTVRWYATEPLYRFGNGWSVCESRAFGFDRKHWHVSALRTCDLSRQTTTTLEIIDLHRGGIRIAKFIFATDAHCGRDRIYRKGKYVLQDAHNGPGIKAFHSFVKDYDPDVVIFGGDMVNCASISHHTRGQNRFREGMRLKDELDLCAKLLVKPVEDTVRRNTRKVWIRGNHERWVDDHIEEYPELEGLVNVEAYLELEEKGWEIIDYGELFQLGKLYFMHGDNLGGAYHSTRAVQQYHRNVRYGHHHTYQVGTEVSAVDNRDFHTAISVPCLANRNPGYAQNKPNRWVNGFLYGEVLNSGVFRDDVVVMVENQFVMDGRIYG
jgi:hypothetical protein